LGVDGGVLGTKRRPPLGDNASRESQKGDDKQGSASHIDYDTASGVVSKRVLTEDIRRLLPEVGLSAREAGRYDWVRLNQTMHTLATTLWKEETGQDVIEYALLTAFVALAACGVFLGAGSSISGIWSQTASNLSSANSAS